MSGEATTQEEEKPSLIQANNSLAFKQARGRNESLRTASEQGMRRQQSTCTDGGSLILLSAPDANKLLRTQTI